MGVIKTKNMYKFGIATKTTINRNTTYKAETIEQKVRRILSNKEPIKDGSPPIYTERNEGVREAYDIRTDRFDIAVDAMDKVKKAQDAKRQSPTKDKEKPTTETKKDGGPEPTPATDSKQ